MPLERVLGAELGRSTATSTASTASRCCSAPASRRSRATRPCERVRPPTAHVFDCDFVIVGIGVQPRTELAEAAGLAVDNGVLWTATCERARRAIFAAGDVANATTTPATGRSASSTGPTP